ncbi:MAG: DUF3333 domain-containing protein, partial [Pseudomonadota bacterium]
MSEQLHPHRTKRALHRLKRRKTQEGLLKWTGRLAFVLVLSVLAALLLSIFQTGRSAFVHHVLTVD